MCPKQYGRVTKGYERLSRQSGYAHRVSQMRTSTRGLPRGPCEARPRSNQTVVGLRDTPALRLGTVSHGAKRCPERCCGVRPVESSRTLLHPSWGIDSPETLLRPLLSANDDMPNPAIPAIALLLVLASVGCHAQPGQSADRPRDRIQPTYEATTGRLTQLSYDANGNGRMETWSFHDGPQVARVEIDANEDGAIDRWEYYDADQKLVKVGFSTSQDGTVDGWAYPAPHGGPERIEYSANRDGRISRTEFYERAVLVRAEQDTNGDGRIDRWETFRNAALASVAFDTTGRGTPDRRLVYDAGGKFDRLEVDPEGDGSFEPERKP
jgi:hypothetical protein